MNLHGLKAIVYKELLHILRDRGTLLLVTVGPNLLDARLHLHAHHRC